MKDYKTPFFINEDLNVDEQVVESEFPPKLRKLINNGKNGIKYQK